MCCLSALVYSVTDFTLKMHNTCFLRPILYNVVNNLMCNSNIRCMFPNLVCGSV